MSQRAKQFISRTVFIIGSFYSLVYLFSCLTPYISPEHSIAFTFLSLAFPFLLAGMMVWLIIVFFFYRKRALFFVLILALGFENIHAVFSFHLSKDFVQEKANKSIRVLSWNVRDFIDSQYYTDTPGNKRRDIVAFIKKADADIVCLQDFSQFNAKPFRSAVKDVLEATGFNYYYFAKDFERTYYWANVQYGTAIFSRYPIVDSGKLDYSKDFFSESLTYADLKIGTDTIRVFNTHLRSMNLDFDATKADTSSGMIKTHEFEFLVEHPTKHERIRHYDLQHVEQVETAKPVMNATKYPYIFCADLNSVPSSYVYQQISKGLTDAFVAKGSGLGGTYDGISPSLRIDVVLMSKHFEAVQYYSPRLHASDHFPVVADVRLK